MGGSKSVTLLTGSNRFVLDEKKSSEINVFILF